jgi:hypothetical protein
MPQENVKLPSLLRAYVIADVFPLAVRKLST